MTKAAERDRLLLPIVDAAVDEAVRRGAGHVVCRPGCSDCCIGAFSISSLDAARLRRGLSVLSASDPVLAARVRDRAQVYLEQYGATFPGDRATGALDLSSPHFDDFAVDAPCPALDPKTGTCDLYSSRPLTCRAFGPALRFSDGSVRACDLCYKGATDEQIAAAAVPFDPEVVEAPLLDDDARTIVAYCLAY